MIAGVVAVSVTMSGGARMMGGLVSVTMNVCINVDVFTPPLKLCGPESVAIQLTVPVPFTGMKSGRLPMLVADRSGSGSQLSDTLSVRRICANTALRDMPPGVIASTATMPGSMVDDHRRDVVRHRHALRLGIVHTGAVTLQH